MLHDEVLLDEEAVNARRRRVRRAWATSAPPEDPAARPGPAKFLLISVAATLLCAAATGITSSIVRLRAKDKNIPSVEAALAATSDTGPASAAGGTEGTFTGLIETGAPPAEAVPVTSTPGPPGAPTAAATGETASPDGVLIPTTQPPSDITAPKPVATALDGAVTVRWPGLTAAGGAASVRVVVRLTDGTPVGTRDVTVGQGGTTVTGARNGVQHVAVVTPRDASGRAGRASPTSDPVTPTTTSPKVPPKVEGIKGFSCNGCVTLVWPFPNNIGPPITRYRATLQPGGAAREMVWGVNGVTIPDLAGGTAYTATVMAVSDVGFGEGGVSGPVTAGRSGTGKPQPPSAPGVQVRADGTWTATFVQSDNAGGKNAVFSVVPIPNGTGALPARAGPVAAQAGASVTVSGKGLRAGTSYQFVAVVNSNGAGVSDQSAPSGTVRTPS